MMYVRYPLSLRNVEDLLAERGIDISHETVRFWWNRFGPPGAPAGPAPAGCPCIMKQRINSIIAGGVLALAAALAASPALAAQDYPPGLFENSPVVPSGPRDTTVPSGRPDATFPFGPPPDAVDPLDDYCAGVPFRTFRSLAEVRRAHAQCDNVHSAAPLWPPEEDQPDE